MSMFSRSAAAITVTKSIIKGWALGFADAGSTECCRAPGRSEMSRLLTAIARWRCNMMVSTKAQTRILAIVLAMVAHSSIAQTNAASTPILQLSFTGGMIADADQTPFLRVYPDGLVHIHYPHYMRRAGDYTLTLTRPEKRALLDSLYGKGIMTVDVRGLKVARGKKLKQLGRIYTPPCDSVNTVLELALDDYQPPGKSTKRMKNIRRRISWHALEHDAEQHPDIAGIQDLRAAVSELLETRSRPDLERLTRSNRSANE